MDEELYEYQGEQYTRQDLQAKYGDKTDEAIKKFGFKKIDIYKYQDQTYTRADLESKYGDKTDEAIKKFGFKSTAIPKGVQAKVETMDSESTLAKPKSSSESLQREIAKNTSQITTLETEKNKLLQKSKSVGGHLGASINSQIKKLDSQISKLNENVEQVKTIKDSPKLDFYKNQFKDFTTDIESLKQENLQLENQINSIPRELRGRGENYNITGRAINKIRENQEKIKSLEFKNKDIPLLDNVEQYGFNPDDIKGFSQKDGKDRLKRLQDQKVIDNTLASQNQKLKFLSDYTSDRLKHLNDYETNLKVRKEKGENVDGELKKLNQEKEKIQTGFKSYVDNELPDVKLTLDEARKESAEEFKKFKNGEGETYFTRTALTGIKDVVLDGTTTFLDMIGADKEAEKLRIDKEVNQIIRSGKIGLQSSLYEDGKIVDSKYGKLLVNDKGQVFDYETEKEITSITDDLGLDINDLKNKANQSKEEGTFFSFGNAITQSGGVVANLLVQLATVELGTKALGLVGKGISTTTKGKIASSTIGGAMGYSSTYEEVLQQLRDSGEVSDDKAKESAHKVATAVATAIAFTGGTIGFNAEALKIFQKQGVKEASKQLLKLTKEGATSKNIFNKSFQLVKNSIAPASKEGVGEIGQEYTEEFFKNVASESVNQDLDSKVLDTDFTRKKFIEIGVLAGFSGFGLGTLGNIKGNTITKINSYEKLSKDLNLSKEVLNVISKEGYYTKEQTDNIFASVEKYHKYKNKVQSKLGDGKKLNKDNFFNVIDVLDEVDKIDIQLKNTPEVYHQELRDKKKQLTEQLKSYYGKKTTQYPTDNQTTKTEGGVKQGETTSEKKIEPLSDTEYLDFVDNDNVSTERLNDIADKVSTKQELTKREQSIYEAKNKEVELLLKQKQDDKENITRVSSQEQVGQEPITTQPIQETSTETTTTSGDVQTQEEVELEERVLAEQEIPIKEQLKKDLESEARYQAEKEVEGKLKLEDREKEDSLNNFLKQNLGRIRPQDFDRYGNPNIRKEDKSFSIQFLDSKAAPLDTRVEELSETFGTEITTQDVIDYIQDRQSNPDKYNLKELRKGAKDVKYFDDGDVFEIYNQEKNNKDYITKIDSLIDKKLSDEQAKYVKYAIEDYQNLKNEQTRQKQESRVQQSESTEQKGETEKTRDKDDDGVPQRTRSKQGQEIEGLDLTKEEDKTKLNQVLSSLEEEVEDLKRKSLQGTDIKFSKKSSTVKPSLTLLSKTLAKMKAASNQSKKGSEVLQAGVNLIKSSNWYKNLDENQKVEFDKKGFFDILTDVDESLITKATEIILKGNEVKIQESTKRIITTNTSIADTSKKIKTTEAKLLKEKFKNIEKSSKEIFKKGNEALQEIKTKLKDIVNKSTKDLTSIDSNSLNKILNIIDKANLNNIDEVLEIIDNVIAKVKRQDYKSRLNIQKNKLKQFKKGFKEQKTLTEKFIDETNKILKGLQGLSSAQQQQVRNLAKNVTYRNLNESLEKIDEIFQKGLSKNLKNDIKSLQESVRKIGSLPSKIRDVAKDIVKLDIRYLNDKDLGIYRALLEDFNATKKSPTKTIKVVEGLKTKEIVVSNPDYKMPNLDNAIEIYNKLLETANKNQLENLKQELELSDTNFTEKEIKELLASENVDEYLKKLEKSESKAKELKNWLLQRVKDGILGLSNKPLPKFQSEKEKNAFVGLITKLKQAFPNINVEFYSGDQEAKKIIGDIQDDTKFQIIGEQGASRLNNAVIVMKNLSVAKQMQEAGKDKKTIKLATGWEKGGDGKWRMEILDIQEKTNIKENILEKIFNGDFVDLYKLIDDKNGLFKVYPQLKNIQVSFADNNKMNDAYGLYSKNNNAIVLNKDKVIDSGNSTITSTLIHEIQHTIQDIEGFAKGGNLTTFLDKEIAKEVSQVEAILNKAIELKSSGKWVYESSSIEQIIKSEQGLNSKIKEWAINIAVKGDGSIKEFLDSTPYNQYKRLAGEVESRNAQKRMNMSMEERAKTLLSETEDVAEEDKIYLKNEVDNGVQESRMGAFDLNNNDTKFQMTESDYKMSHSAPTKDDSPLYDLKNVYGEDIYSDKAWYYYGDGDRQMDKKSAAIIQSLRNKPNAKVKVYRAVPKNVDKINNGDWVSINKDYAKKHGEMVLDGEYTILEQEVLASQVYSDGNSMHEQGIQFFKDNEGGIYGFFHNGKVYLNTNELNTNTPFHEFGHVFANLLKQQFPKEHQNLINLVKQETGLMNDYRNNPDYKHLKTDDDIADEVFAKLFGDKGETIWKVESKERESKIRNIIRKFWEKLKQVLGKTYPNATKFKLEDFQNATLDDIIGNITKDAIKGRSIFSPETKNELNEIETLNKIRADFDKKINQNKLNEREQEAINILRNATDEELADLDLQTLKDSVKILDNVLENQDFSAVYHLASKLQMKKSANEFYNKYAEKTKKVIITEGGLTTLQDISLFLKDVFGDSKISSAFDYASGLFKLKQRDTELKRILNDTKNRYEKLIQKVKKFKNKKITNAENTAFRAVAGQLIQGSTLEDFDINKSRIEQHIERQKEYSSRAAKKMAEIIESAYNEIIKNVKTQEDVLNLVAKKNDGNKEVLEFWLDEFAKYSEALEFNTHYVHNEKFGGFIENYLPIVTTSEEGIKGDIEDDKKLEGRPSFMKGGIVKPKPTGSTIERNKAEKLPDDRILNLDFDSAMFNKLFRTLEDIHLSEAIIDVRNFLSEIKKKKLLAKETEEVLVKKINDTIDVYTKKPKDVDNVNKTLDWIERNIGGIGRMTALAGVFQYPVQQAGVAANIGFRLGVKNLDILPNEMASSITTEWTELEKMFPISRREHLRGGTNFMGESITDAAKLKAFRTIAEKVSKPFGNLREKVSKAVYYSLVKGDVHIARASWRAFYKKYLRENGYDLKDIDMETEHLYFKDDKIRQNAAAYAETMIEETQRGSDDARAAKFFRDTSLKNRILRTLTIPLQVFNIHSKARMFVDIYNLIRSEGKDLDLAAKAASSLGGTIAEVITFHMFKAYVIEPFLKEPSLALFYELFDIEEPEEEDEEAKERFKQKKLYSNIIKDLTPIAIGTIGENAAIEVLNLAVFANDIANDDSGQYDGLMIGDKYKKWGENKMKKGEEGLPFYRYGDKAGVGDLLTTGAGLYGTVGSKVIEATEELHLITSENPKLIDYYGNEQEYEFTDAEKRLLKASFFANMMNLTFGFERETMSNLNKMKKGIVKGAEIKKN